MVDTMLHKNLQLLFYLFNFASIFSGVKCSKAKSDVKLKNSTNNNFFIVFLLFLGIIVNNCKEFVNTNFIKKTDERIIIKNYIKIKLFMLISGHIFYKG